MTRRFCLPAACLCGLLLLAGCGDDRPARVPVSGQVLIDGEPLTKGTVRVIPQGSRASRGNIGEDGRFVLNCYEAGDGVVVGTHSVAISANEPIGDSGMKWHAPKKYANQRTSGLEITVEKEPKEVKFELTWDGGKPFVEGSKGKSDDSNEGEDF